MTISSTEVKKQHLGNGVTKDFAFPYLFMEDAHLRIFFFDIAAQTEVEQFTGFTITGAGVDEGGTISFTVAPPTGTRVTIYREVPLTQETDYVENTKFPADAHERALDLLTMQNQQQREALGRVVQVPKSDTATSLEIPAVGARANKALVFDADGNVAVSVDDYIDQAANAAASAAAAAASASAATTSATSASTSATNAATSATAAAASSAAASTSETNAAASASSASTSATSASTSATAATASATTATTGANTATTKATNAAASATAAAASASAASTSATNAAASQTAAATSATSASTSATNAWNSATAAATSATAAAASAAAVNLPSAAGQGTNYLRQKATAGGLEYRTPDQVLSDIGGGINALTEDATPDAAADYVMTYDASAGAPKKVKLSNAAPQVQTLHMQHYEANGTDAGTPSTGNYYTRKLNRTVVNSVTGASHNTGTNQFVLPAGTYEWVLNSQFYIMPNGHIRCRLYDKTNSATVGVSDAMGYGSTSGISECVGRGRFTLAAQKTLELQYRVSTSSSAGLGLPANYSGQLGDTEEEIYTNLIIRKVG